MREQRADLSGYLLALDGRLHCSTIGVTHDQNHLGSQNHCAVFQASDDFRSDDVSSNAGHKDVPDALIEDKLDGYSRIGTGKHGSEWLLLLYGMLLKYGEVLLVMGQAPRHKALVTLRHGCQCSIGS